MIPICNAPGCNKECRLGKNNEYKMHCSRGCCARHNASKSSEKRKANNLLKYGTEHPISSKIVREKIHSTLSDRYGVDNVSQIESVKRKKENTLLKNYGVIHPMQSNEIRERVKSTLNEKYGVDHVSYIGKSKEQIEVLTDIVKIQELNKTYNLYSIGRQYGFSDRTLREIFENNGIEPIRHFRSSFELEIVNYIKTIYNGIIEPSFRVDGKEIDIYIPEYKLGIECNGAYWHSEIAGNRGKEYHIEKLSQIRSHGIDLIQIWDFEWYTKQDIVKSMISHKLKNSKRVYGRNTEVIKLSKDQERLFFNRTHIQGFNGSTLCYGIVYNNDIIAAMSFGKPRYNKLSEWELIRFSNDINVTVIGGASKLFKRFIYDINPLSVVSYSHRHISNGNIYKVMGFDFSSSTGPSYRYTSDYRTFSSRVTFQKHKLKTIIENYDPSITEWGNMKNNGYDRIWDCGNDVWIWKRK